MDEIYNPALPYKPYVHPKLTPPKQVPSFLREKGQRLNALFYEGDGQQVRDLSSYGNHGTIHGAKWVPTPWGWGLEFDGVDDQVDCGTDASLQITDALTIEAWVKYQITAGFVGIVSKYAYTASKYTLYTSDGDLIFGVGGVDAGGGGLADSILGPDLDNYADEWHHLAATFGDSRLVLYFDGELYDENSTNVVSLAITSAHLRIGRYYHSGVYSFKGSIDEVRIYDRVLSADDISRRYLAMASCLRGW